MIFTFYSYKGGVGRSMALANIAELFYESGNKVIMIDWDLDAPGLERFFFTKPKEIEKIQQYPGVIDMLLDVKSEIASGSTNFRPTTEYMAPIHNVNESGGELWLISAGQRSKGSFSSYAKSVVNFDWQDFYKNWAGEQFFNRLIKDLDKLADVILIDSRTGINEIGGVCTYQLADVVIMLCTTNQQNVTGTLRVARDLTREEVREVRGKRPLELVIIPSRVEILSENNDLNTFLHIFDEKFKDFTPNLLSDTFTSFSDLSIPYVSHYAFNEMIAVQQTNTVNQSVPLERAYQDLFDVLSRLSGKLKAVDLEVPTGPVRSYDPFYIERDVDLLFKQKMMQKGSIVSLIAPGQRGKSSLLARGIEDAKQIGADIVNIDLKQLDSEILDSLALFLHFLNNHVARKLEIEQDEISEFWQKNLPPKINATRIFEEVILPKIDRLLILTFDDVDKLLDTKYFSDFFGLLRSWYNQSASDDRWQKLTIVMTLSIQPYLLIQDINQSPFNVGLNLYLDDFSLLQLEELNKKYQSKLPKNELLNLLYLLGGHPYLCRLAFSTILREDLNWTKFKEKILGADDPFGEHLRIQFQILRRDSSKSSIKFIENILSNRGAENTNDIAIALRLLRAGIIKQEGNRFLMRCKLYEDYYLQNSPW